MCYTCQESDADAERHTIGSQNSRSASWSGLINPTKRSQCRLSIIESSYISIMLTMQQEAMMPVSFSRLITGSSVEAKSTSQHHPHYCSNMLHTILLYNTGRRVRELQYSILKYSIHGIQPAACRKHTCRVHLIWQVVKCIQSHIAMNSSALLHIGILASADWSEANEHAMMYMNNLFTLSLDFCFDSLLSSMFALHISLAY